VDSGILVNYWSAPSKTTRIALSPDGTFAIEGGEHGVVRFWNVSAGPEKAQVAAHNHYLSGVAFSRDGKRIATASTMGDAILWDLPARQQLGVLRGHLLGVHAVAFSPDGRRLATASGGREAIKLWDVDTHEEVATLEGRGSVFRTVAFSPDGNTLMGINLLGVLHLWRAPTAEDIEQKQRKANTMQNATQP
jgi:WD40 repeat protein